MIRLPDDSPDRPVILIEIGNTTTTLGTWANDQVRSPIKVRTVDESAFDEAFDAQIQSIAGGRPAATVIGSVVPAALGVVRARVERQTAKPPVVLGETIPLPMDLGVIDTRAIGVDRVCQAYAAFEKIQAGCTVVGLGTAITVDLVDDDGVLLGGAILPGLRMQLAALHEHTAQLPKVDPGFPELPYGRNTVEAMQTGVCAGIVGAVRNLVEGYATHLNRWPQVVATGGDLEFFQSRFDFVDSFVSNLALRGVGLSYAKHMAEQGA